MPLRDNPGLEHLEESHLENRLLAAGYMHMMLRRYPFEDPDSTFEHDEDAYVFDLEKEHLTLPEKLAFENIKDSIAPRFHERLQSLWELLVIQEDKHKKHAGRIKIKLQKADSALHDDEAEKILDLLPLKIREEFRTGMLAIVSDGKSDEDIGNWQSEEKGLRRNFEDDSKRYIVLLRQYCEALLETYQAKNEEGKEVGEKEYILPKDHSLRLQVVEKNRYLRLIDAIHRGLQISKTLHHNQKKGRLRKSGNLPYVIHGKDVTHSTVLDVIPYALAEHKSILASLIGIIGPIHDVIEDADVDLETLMKKIEDLVDKYDTNIESHIGSSFVKREDMKDGREEYKRNVLNIVKRNMRPMIKRIMRILSNNCKFSDKKELREGFTNSPASPEITLSAMGYGRKEMEEENKRLEAEGKTERVTLDEIQARGLKKARELQVISGFKELGVKALSPKPSETFTEFPEEEEKDDGKTTSAIVRLATLGDKGEIEQTALILKLEDRANNVTTPVSTNPASQRRMLRTTVSRIIAWAMLDHDHAKMPLYNSLPRAIKNTMIAYEKLIASNPEVIEDLDHQYLARLKEWQTTAIRFTVPAKVEAVLNKNRTLQNEKS